MLLKGVQNTQITNHPEGLSQRPESERMWFSSFLVCVFFIFFYFWGGLKHVFTFHITELPHKKRKPGSCHSSTYIILILAITIYFFKTGVIANNALLPSYLCDDDPGKSFRISSLVLQNEC